MDERAPFVQLIFKSVAVSLVLEFCISVAITFIKPELTAPLFVPMAAALFLGVLGFQVELARKQYGIALFSFALALVLFPLVGWALLALARIPYESTAAKFVPLIPQALVAPAFFKVEQRRYDRRTVA